MFDSKFAIVLRDDLAPWQALNVTAFLTQRRRRGKRRRSSAKPIATKRETSTTR